jgi:hypothetical protein
MNSLTTKQMRPARTAAAKADVALIFVIGPPRSGTTLLSGLLAASDKAYDVLPECALLTSTLRTRLDAMRVEADPARHTVYAVTDKRLDTQYRNLAEWIVSNAVETFLPEVRDYLILKDPNICFIAKDLHRFFRRPIRSVGLIRDPRDIVASQLLVLERLGNERSVGDACAGILPYFENLIAALDHPNPQNPILQVRYEDLVRDEEHTRSRLEEFCGFSLNFEEYDGLQSANFDVEDPWYQDTLIGPINPNRVGNFRHKLDAEEILYVETMFEAVMQRFDYAPSSAYRQFLHLEDQLREVKARFFTRAAELESEKQELADRQAAALATAEQTIVELADEVATRAAEARAAMDQLEQDRHARADEARIARERLDQLALDLEEAGKQAIEARAISDDLRLAREHAQTEVQTLGAEVGRLSAELDAAEATIAATEAARQQLADEVSVMREAGAGSESNQSPRDALADIERRLTLAEEERDLAVARLETLESSFLVRTFLLPPGWSPTQPKKAGRKAD